MLCEIAGIEPTCCTMNPIKQMLRSSQMGAFCLKHKKINEEIFLTYAIASKIAISTISMTNIIENILNAFFISLSPPFYFFLVPQQTVPALLRPTFHLQPQALAQGAAYSPSMAACSYLQHQSLSIQLSLRDNKHLSL